MRWMSQLVVMGCALASSRIAEAAPPTAWAEPPGRSRAPSPVTADETEYDDYRLSLLASDAVAISLVVAGGVAYDDDKTLGNLGLLGGTATYALAAPILHLVHEQPGRALGSFALRVGLPTVGVLIFAGLAVPCQDEGEGEGWCAYGAAIVGGTVMLGGVATAMIIDDVFLGRAPKAPKNESGGSSLRAGFAPSVDPKRRSLGLSIFGVF